jgi:Ca2+-binding RTX toxin-like protein
MYGKDTLDGGVGADILKGGSDADTFVWDEATARLNGGIDHISDFDTAGGDVIGLRGFGPDSVTGIHDYASFLTASHDTAAGVYVSFGSDTNGILIEGVTLANISANDVIFS